MQLQVGMVTEGKVTGITKFGAFVALPDGKSGLVHISEIANTFVNDVHDYVQDVYKRQGQDAGHRLRPVLLRRGGHALHEERRLRGQDRGRDVCKRQTQGSWVFPAEIGPIEALTLEPDAGNADEGSSLRIGFSPVRFISPGRRRKEKER